MSVSFRCGCGQQLEVEAEHAGQPVECPTCQQVVTAPRPTPTLAKRAVRPAEPAAEYEVVDEPTKPSSRPKRWADDDDEDDDRPRRKKRSADDRDRARHLDKPKHSGWFGTENWILSGGVIGGLIAMLVALVWFVLGLMADRIFFYPPILFVVGLVGMIKGMMSGGGEDD